MAECVLIAQPVRKGTPEALVELAGDLVASLTYPDFERVVWENSQPPTPWKYHPNAAARNQFIDLFLHDEHDYVLWMDIDLVEVPEDLIERLVAVSKDYDGAIVAPMVWGEHGKFYDIGGFIKDGHWASMEDGVAGDELVEIMESVGTCYLVPAWLYRAGLRYAPNANDVEHLSFCAAARERGVMVLALRDVEVLHAHLPDYGEAIH